MSQTQTTDLIIAKCNACGVYRRGLTQAEGVRFRDVDHAKHEGVMLGTMAEPEAPPGFDPVATAADLTRANQDLKAAWLSVDAVLRPILSTAEAEKARVGAWPGLMLADFLQAARLSAGPVLMLQQTHDTALRLLQVVKPQVRAARETFLAQGQRALAPPSSIEELVSERTSRVEADLAAAGAAVDRLDAATTFYGPELDRARRALHLHLKAVVAAVRAAQVDQAAARRAAMKVECQLQEMEPPEETAILQLLASVGGEVDAAVPIIRWGPDPLSPPALI